MRKRFMVLRIIGVVFKIFAWIVLVVGVIFSVLALAFGLATPIMAFGQRASVPGGVVGLVIGIFLSVLYFLMFYAIGEGIYLFLSMEENTRETNSLLRELRLPRAPETAPSEQSE